METRANYLMVGSFVLILAVGLVAFVIWLTKFQFAETFKDYDIFFTGSVTGLKVGSPVRYSGVKVGEVVFIGLDLADPSRVRALIKVQDNTPVQVDTVASLALEGLTGGQYILLSGGKLDAPPLEAKAGQKRPVIPSKPSAVEQLLEGAPELIAKANSVLTEANKILGEQNRQKISFILDNFAQLSQVLAERSTDLSTAIHDGAATMANLNNATKAFEGMASDLRRDSKRLVDRADNVLKTVETTSQSIDTSVGDVRNEMQRLVQKFSDTAEAFTSMADAYKIIAVENRGPIRDFTQNGLYDFNSLLIEAREVLGGLGRVTTEVERDPARFLFGNQQQGYEVPR